MNSFVIEDIELSKIIRVVCSLQLSKSLGLDTVSVKIMNHNIDILLIHILHLFNYSIERSIFPENLKVANAVPIYKEGEQSLPCNYTLISVLGTIQLPETCYVHAPGNLWPSIVSSISDRWFHTAEVNSICVPCPNANVNKALHDNKIALVIYLDVRAAFDTVSHTILLDLLSRYGFRRRIFEFSACYLKKTPRVCSNATLDF